MADKETIRPVYSELQGYLAQAPKGKHYDSIGRDEILNQFNAAVEELMKVTNKDYARFKIKPESAHDPAFASDLTVGEYRGKLGGIIARLHGEYFSDEPAPFASMPSTIITQSQNQSVHVEFILEMSNLINDKMNKAPEGTPEKKFLEKIRGTLSKVKNVSQFVTLVIMTAKEMGISLEQLASLFTQTDRF